MSGLLIAAPSSGSGKTTVTLGILRALRQRGVAVRSAKSGPDYIDPRFHAAASGADCVNLDAWAMSPAQVSALAATDDLLIVEGAMGLFDGAAPDDRGSSADLARMLGLPVVLIIDAARMSGSIAPIVAGFAGFDAGVKIAGVILNQVGSDRHAQMLRRALGTTGIPVLGILHRQKDIAHPSRHLGLVQADERPDLEAFLDRAAAHISAAVDLDALVALAAPTPSATPFKITPPAQRIAVARDAAFGFAYPHLLNGWRAAGAELSFFSPIDDEPAPEADLVYLPGGYPELHAGRISAASRFIDSLRNAKQVFGECGGYMVMGDGLTDSDGKRHQMAGLLRLETSFAARKLHLGYRTVHANYGPMAGNWNAHEFHYATTLKAEGEPLFTAQDASGNALPPMGLRNGTACGSFAHLIAQR